MSRIKNCNYKSTTEFYNTVAQNVTVDTVVTSPLTVNLGAEVTDTGVAIDFSPSAITINNSGTYDVSVLLTYSSTVLGRVTFALMLDNTILPETVKTIELPASTISVIPIETIRTMATCCSIPSHSLSVIAYGDGTATGTITNVSGGAIKL